MYELVDTTRRDRLENLPIALKRWALAWAGAQDALQSAYTRCLHAQAAAAYAKNISDFYLLNAPSRLVWNDLYEQATRLAVQFDAIDHSPDSDPEDAARAALDQMEAAYSIPTKAAAAMLGITARGVRSLAKHRRYGRLKGRDFYLTLAEVNAMRDAKPGRPPKQG